MKRSTKLIVALLVVVAALVVIYRLMHRVPSADLEANVHMSVISTFSFGADGFGEEVQRYRNGEYCDSFRFQWWWEDSYSRNPRYFWKPRKQSCHDMRNLLIKTSQKKEFR